MIDNFESEAEALKTPRDALTFATWARAGLDFVRSDKPAIDFASWDFLNSSADPRVVRAAQEELQANGFGSPIGRRWLGASPATIACEENLAKFWGLGSALLFPGINQAVFSLILALGHEQDLFVVPETTSGPVIDVATLIGGTIIRYKPGELGKTSLPSKLFRRKLFFIDSVEANGTFTDLSLHFKLVSEAGGVMLIDDSIGFGVCNHANWIRSVEILGRTGILLCTNFSRRFGIQGAGIGGSAAAIKLISNRSRALTGEPAYSGPNAAALNQIICAGTSDIELVALDKVAEEFRLNLISKEITPLLPRPSAPIVCIPVKDLPALHQFWCGLLERGVLADRFVSIDPQSPGGYIRLFMRRSHSVSDRSTAMQAVISVAKILT